MVVSGVEYYIVRDANTTFKAEKKCNSLGDGYHLLSVENDKEMKTITVILRRQLLLVSV